MLHEAIPLQFFQADDGGVDPGLLWSGELGCGGDRRGYL